MEPNNDNVEGTVNTSIGSLKERIDEALRKDELKNEGAVQKIKGRVQKLGGTVKDALKQGRALFAIKSKRD